MAETYALIPAAGRGARFNRPYNKVLAPLGGKPLLAHTLSAFQSTPEVDAVLLMTDSCSLEAVREIVASGGFAKVRDVLLGGDTRQASVRAGLDRLPASCRWVAVHDAARPLVTPEVIRRCLVSAREHGSGVAAVPVVDTVKATNREGWAVGTIPRDGLWAVQTPQAFERSLLEEAHREAERRGLLGTDEASLVEQLGRAVRLVEGSVRNLKVTRPEDADLAEALLAFGAGPDADTVPEEEPERPGSRGAPGLRVGCGYDIHRLTPGRRLVLGGVEIPHELGLEGHSDADVLTHALMDALLGAAGDDDIGHLFPNTDPRYEGCSSLGLLGVVRERLSGGGWRVLNADVTVLAERPKLSPHIPAMKAALARTLGISPDQIGIKATTHEGVGALGRGEAMVAQAVVMLHREP